MYLQDGLPNRRRTVELHHQGIYGTGVTAYGDAGSFISLACPGYCNNIGGGKPPPPTVHPVQHSGALEFTEWEAPCHLPVRQGGGEESPTADIRGDVGEYREDLPGLLKTAIDDHFV